MRSRLFNFLSTVKTIELIVLKVDSNKNITAKDAANLLNEDDSCIGITPKAIDDALCLIRLFKLI